MVYTVSRKGVILFNNVICSMRCMGRWVGLAHSMFKATMTGVGQLTRKRTTWPQSNSVRRSPLYQPILQLTLWGLESAINPISLPNSQQWLPCLRCWCNIYNKVVEKLACIWSYSTGNADPFTKMSWYGLQTPLAPTYHCTWRARFITGIRYQQVPAKKWSIMRHFNRTLPVR